MTENHGINTIVSVPLLIDFTNPGYKEQGFSIGKVDRSYDDILGITALPDAAGKVGSFYIGGSSPTEIESVFLKVPSPGFVRITIYATEKTPPQLALFPLKAVYNKTPLTIRNHAPCLRAR